MWQHSVACAFACQAVATRSGAASSTTAFTVGILHDVGKIALSQVLDESRLLAAIHRSCGDAELTHIELERSALGLDHAAAASLVAAQWQLPVELAEALSGHHDEHVVGGDNALPAILHVADQLALRAGIGNVFPHATIGISQQAMKRLRLRESDVEPIADALARELAAASELLNLDVAVGR
jgi:HD-like signal output (HDOD) protein